MAEKKESMSTEAQIAMLQLKTTPMRDAARALLDDMSRSKNVALFTSTLAIYLSFVATDVFSKIMLIVLGVLQFVAYLMNDKGFRKAVDYAAEWPADKVGKDGKRPK
jgi:hypothetical protein